MKDKHFFWPNNPTRQGFMYHQFTETGIFCFKNGTNQIGTIIVEPRKNINHVSISTDGLSKNKIFEQK